jgi:hypothetical protein
LLVFWLAWARAYWSVDRRKASVVFLIGLTFSLEGAQTAGALTMGGAHEVFIFVLPVTGSFLAFELMLSVTAIVPKVRFLNLWVLASICGLAVLLYFAGPSIASAMSGPYGDLKSPALLFLGIGAVLLAAGGLLLGATQAHVSREPGENWLTAVRSYPNFRVGVIMLGGFVGAAILFVVDAALKLSGS